jgi:hypothetical protein
VDLYKKERNWKMESNNCEFVSSELMTESLLINHPENRQTNGIFRDDLHR